MSGVMINEPTEAEIEAAAEAISGAEPNYEMRLVSPIDSVSTYRVEIDGAETAEFNDAGDSHDYVGRVRRAAQARAALQAAARIRGATP